jgi:hypothetical protein
MNILKTVRTRQLIDAGTNLFYAQYGLEYEVKCPDSVYNHPATGKGPKSWIPPVGRTGLETQWVSPQ